MYVDSLPQREARVLAMSVSEQLNSARSTEVALVADKSNFRLPSRNKYISTDSIY